MHDHDQNRNEIVERLRVISEQLADQALSFLKQAHAAGELKRPDEERILTQARRAVEKAINLLSRN